MKIFLSAWVLLILFPVLALAQQDVGNQESDCMPGMPMPGCPDSTAQQSAGMQMGKTGLMTMQGMQPQTFLQAIVHHASSGTSAEPNSTPTPMLMTQRGAWMLMFHANAFILDEQQSSSRGGDKLFSTNWLMPMAQRELGLGVLTVPRPEREPGLSRWEEAPTGRLEAPFRPAISTGGTVAFDISGPRELDELRRFGDGSSMFR